MKKFSLLIFILPLFAGAQITLTRADFPKPTSGSVLPDSVLFTNANPNATAYQTSPSANTIWNESNLKGTTAYQKFLPMSATPLIFQLVFLSCDYAQPLLGSNSFGGNTLTDAYEYYNYSNTSDRLEIKGFGGNITIPGQPLALPLPANFSSPDVIYKFPLAFGNIDSSDSGFDVTIPLGTGIGNIQLKRTQRRVNSVDAWGTLSLPSGTFDVLRVVSSIDRVDSIITSFFPIGIPSKSVEYKWLAAAKKIPVLQVNGNMLAGNFTPTTTTYWGSYPTGLQPNLDHATKVTIYPNPAQSQFFMDIELNKSEPVNLFIYDMMGRKTAEFHYGLLGAGSHHECLPLDGLTPGLYQLKYQAGNEMIVQSLNIQ